MQGGRQTLSKTSNFNSKLRTYTKPKCYLISEENIDNLRSMTQDVLNDQWQKFLLKLGFIIRENPYFTAKILHQIAIKAEYSDTIVEYEDSQFNLKTGESVYSTKIEEQKSELLRASTDDDDAKPKEKLHEMNAGDILPEKIRSLLLNMSRYFFRSLYSQELQRKHTPNFNLLRALKIWLQYEESDELFQNISIQKR